jgi:hypothetical protein
MGGMGEVYRAGFSHPHICRVYDVGDHAGVEYLVHGASAYLDYINIEPTLDGLRDDPRFLELLRRMNLPFVDVNRGRSDAHPRS